MFTNGGVAFYALDFARRIDRVDGRGRAIAISLWFTRARVRSLAIWLFGKFARSSPQAGLRLAVTFPQARGNLRAEFPHTWGPLRP